MSQVVLLLILALCATSATSASITNVETLDEQLLQKWSRAALSKLLLKYTSCIALDLADEATCSALSSVKEQQVAVYMGRPKVDIESIEPADMAALSDSSFLYHVVGGKHVPAGARHKVYAILPDSANTRESKVHDAVLVLDPYPEASFGHFVAVLYADFGIEDQSACKGEHQVLTSDLTCLTLARKTRCPNLVDRSSSYSSSANGHHQQKKCYIDFLPSVHLADENSVSTAEHPSPDLLECVKLPGFAPCPKLRSVAETDKLVCDGTGTNAKRCDTSYSGVGTRCKLFQTCDRAVLLGGGWSRQHSGVTSLNNMYVVNDMLDRLGFLEENIKIFYGNGGPRVESRTVGGDPRPMMSSAIKTGLRGHLRTVCETRHCAESFFLYLNSPTTVDGDMLLWDVDSNGIADQLETYSLKEFLSDIANCQARRVILVVDQSNAHNLVHALKASSNHDNVVVFYPGKSVSVNGQLTSTWVQNAQPTACLTQLHQTNSISGESISIHDNSGGSLSKVSLIGAPCEVSPPLSSRELRSLYQGCQNVPTSVWFSSHFANLSSAEEEETETEEEDEEDLQDEPSQENLSRNTARRAV